MTYDQIIERLRDIVDKYHDDPNSYDNDIKNLINDTKAAKEGLLRRGKSIFSNKEMAEKYFEIEEGGENTFKIVGRKTKQSKVFLVTISEEMRQGEFPRILEKFICKPSDLKTLLKRHQVNNEYVRINILTRWDAEFLINMFNMFEEITHENI